MRKHVDAVALAVSMSVGWGLGLPAAAEAQEAPQELRYRVLCERTACGELRVQHQPAAGGGFAQVVRFSYRDNGRGPDLDEQYRFDAQGRLAFYKAEGKATFGSPIGEQFERLPEAQGGAVRWTSQVDRGEAAQAAPLALYQPVESSPAWSAQSVRAVLQAGGKRLGLPAGQLSVERVLDLQLPAPVWRAADGHPPAVAPHGKVTLYALVGVGLTPEYVWLTDDPAQQLFAAVYPGFGGVLPQGWEAAIDRLEAAQLAAHEKRLEDQAQRLRQPLPGLTLIAGVRWFDAAAARLRGPSDIYLFNGRIAHIREAGSKVAGVAQRIDGAGKTLLPGLFDMHGHLTPDDGLLNVAAGVTTVRDVGNQMDLLTRLRERIDSGRLIGTHVVGNGFIEGASPFASATGQLAATEAEALNWVDWYAARGYRQLKLYNSIKPEWVPAIVQRARERGLKVGGHVPAFMTAQQAVQQGFDELHHINQVTLNFLVGPKDDTRTLLRFVLVGDKAHALNLNGPRVQAFVKLLKQRGTVVDPTVAVFEDMFLLRSGQPSFSYGAVADHLPISLQRAVRKAQMDITDGNQARYRASFQVMLDLIGHLYRAGIPIVPGTDGFTGFTLQRELELYVQAGIPAPKVLQLATLGAARVAGLDGETGRIAPGLRADLVLVDGDPTQRMADLRRTSLVIRAGHAYAPAQLYETLGIRPFVAATPVQRALPPADKP